MRKLYPPAACCLLLVCLTIGFQLTTERASADGGGHFPVPQLPAGAMTPAINGTTADWPSNAKLCATVSGECDMSVLSAGGHTGKVRLLLKNSDDPVQDDELYIFVSTDDSTDDAASDTITVMFDLSHDHTQPAGGVAFESTDNHGLRIKRDGTTNIVFGQLNSLSDGPTPGDLATRKSIANAAGSWAFEAKLIPSDLGVNNFGALVGAAVVAVDGNLGGSKKSAWPSTTSLVDPMTWANLTMRLPIDYALLIDQSGSMSGTKWNAVRRAGDNFAVTISKLKDTGLDTEYAAQSIPPDRIGLANFTWNTGPADSTIVAPLATIPGSPPAMGYATSSLPSSPGGWTPIGWGINRTSQMFSGVVPNTTTPFNSRAATIAAMEASARKRVVMLLTDGQHNTPNSTLNYSATASSDFSYVPAPCATNSLVNINTVAVGDEATVDTMTLDNIKNCFSGKAFTLPGSSTYNFYNIANVATEGQLTAQLTRFFIETLTPYYHWNFVNDQDGGVPDFPLGLGERKILIVAFWANKADANTISINKPVGGPASGPGDTNLGIATIVINNPPAGTYTGFSAAVTAPSHTMVLVDLRTEALFALDNQPHGTGSTITLRGKLREDGKPITGADVRVDIARPEEGFGTYVSTHTLPDCQTAHPPQLPSAGNVLEFLPRFGRDATGANANLNGVVIAPGGIPVITPSGTTSTGSADVPAPRFDLINKLFAQCGKSGLDRAEDNGLKLFDDGTNGDATAGDGLYTLSFENTKLEGSYVFRFRATGTTPSGAKFTRTRQIGQYVRVDVDPASSPLDSRDLQQSGTTVVREYHITPRDRFGGYLGPGHGDLLDFNTSAGVFVSPVIDYNNGIYSRVLRFDRKTENPIVTVSVDGQTIKSKGTFTSQQGFEFFPYVGGFFFQQGQGLDNGPVVGARFGYRFPNQLALEAETGVTFTKFSAGVNAGRRVHLFQLLGNVRYDIEQWGNGNWTPYVIGGAGAVIAQSNFGDDDTLAVHAGFGSTFKITNHVGFRADGRVFRLGHLYNAPARTAFQFNAGVVFRF